MASMNQLIAANKRNSWLIMSLMFLVLVILGVAIGLAFSQAEPYGGLVGAVVAGVIAFCVSLFGFFSGDSAILSMSGAKEIQHADNPQLFNVVEEMSIAAGLPMPKVYVIDDGSPNAFATGRDPAHASITVTTGLLAKLRRDELQGVVAHEMSHIRNYDIRFAMLMAILVGTIVLISDAFVRSLRMGGRIRSKGKGGGAAVLVIMLIAILFAIVAPILAKLIQLAVSRQREYLADASGAELTRYPEGLASALEKISRDTDPLDEANRATAHLYIVNPVMRLEDRTGESAWDSHPPIQERIKRLREMK
jgi:heat shock protein HtpX